MLQACVRRRRMVLISASRDRHRSFSRDWSVPSHGPRLRSAPVKVKGAAMARAFASGMLRFSEKHTARPQCLAAPLVPSLVDDRHHPDLGTDIVVVALFSRTPEIDAPGPVHPSLASNSNFNVVPCPPAPAVRTSSAGAGGRKCIFCGNDLPSLRPSLDETDPPSLHPWI